MSEDYSAMTIPEMTAERRRLQKQIEHRNRNAMIAFSIMLVSSAVALIAVLIGKVG